MLELERLNGESFDELVERAVKIAQRYGGEWNNFQAADPGMTLVDLFAWLKALQHEYMSVILPESRRRFLALLDIRRRLGRGAETVAVLSGAEEDMVIPAGTKWLAGDMVFENPEPAGALAAQLTEVRFEGGGQEVRCQPSMFDGNRFFQVFPGLGPAPSRQPDGRMVLCFTRPIPPGQGFSLFVEVHAQAERNPVGEEPFRPMAEIGWEVWTDSGWAPAEVVQDDTHEFLFSGLITLRHDAEMARGEDGYLLRAVLRRDGYDLPPLLKRVAVNGAALRQQDTQVEHEQFESGQPVALTSHLGRWGRRRVFLRDGDGWAETADFTCEEQPGQTLLHLPRPHEGVLVVCWAEGRDIVLGSGTGFSGQALDFPQAGVLDGSVELMVGERTPAGLRFHPWERAEDFYSAGPFTRCFVLDGEADVIRFGDHQRGVMPPKGTDNILLIGLKTCRGQGSNVKPGSVAGIAGGDPALAALRVEQPTPAIGGEDPERFEDTAARACQVLGAGAGHQPVPGAHRLCRAGRPQGYGGRPGGRAGGAHPPGGLRGKHPADAGSAQAAEHPDPGGMAPAGAAGDPGAAGDGAPLPGQRGRPAPPGGGVFGGLKPHLRRGAELRRILLRAGSAGVRGPGGIPAHRGHRGAGGAHRYRRYRGAAQQLLRAKAAGFEPNTQL